MFTIKISNSSNDIIAKAISFAIWVSVLLENSKTFLLPRIFSSSTNVDSIGNIEVIKMKSQTISFWVSIKNKKKIFSNSMVLAEIYHTNSQYFSCKDQSRNSNITMSLLICGNFTPKLSKPITIPEYKKLSIEPYSSQIENNSILHIFLSINLQK